MSLHDLLADISFRVLVILLIFIVHIIVGSCHLLHLHVGSYRLLAIDLADEGLHTFGHALAHLQSHI
jgi:hypothetical protein